MKKRKQEPVQLVKLPFKARHKIFYRFIIFVLILAIFIAGFQIFNYAKFVLGFDLTLRLGVDKNDINLVNSAESEIEFNIDKITNIFCETNCHYRFIDLGKNITLANDSFKLLQSLTKKISQTIRAPETGEGQDAYAFEVFCSNQPTLLCNTEGLEISRRTIITLEYNLSEEQLKLKNVVGESIHSAQIILVKVNSTLNKITPTILANNSYIINQYNYNKLNKALKNLSTILSENILLWVNQQYSLINLGQISNALISLEANLDSFNKNLNSSIISYNLMIANISNMAQNLEKLKDFNLNQSQAEILETEIISFNNFIYLFDKEKSLDNKQSLLNDIYITEFFNQTVNFAYNYTKINLLNLTEIKINLEDLNDYSNLTLPETNKICCLDNSCKPCEIQKKYPIILLHGHNFNMDISADNIINDFGILQGKLESTGYLNTGELYLYEPTRTNPGLLGTLLKPIAVRPSYYFDFLKKPQGYKSIQIKSENIDTYTIRLKEIIENIKYETNSSKVIIIAHSMGGLVVRRYIQIFGKGSLDRLIFIDTPNLGISGTIANSCSLFGAVSECNDMNSESLFINKLNREDYVMPPTYNIVGSGCKMNEGDGDGVVLKDHGILPESDNVKNYFINGTCSGVNFLHNNILNVNNYPEVFNIIEKALNEN